MKIFKSGNWKHTALLIPVAIIVGFLPGSPEELFSFFQYRDRYCSHNASSPYCNFSVVRTIEGHPTASAIVISADGQTLVSGGQDKTIKVWELQTGKLKKTLRSDSGAINDLAIAPDGKTVVSGSSDRLVRIWDITSNRPPQLLIGHSGSVTHVHISSNGKTIMSRDRGDSPEIKVWDMVTGEQKAKLPYIHFDDISPDGKTVLITLPSSKLVAWDVATNQQQVLQQFFSPSSNSGLISLDGQTLVNIKRARKDYLHLQLSDLKTGKVKAKKRFSRKIFEPFNIALSRNFMIGSTSKGLTVWNLQTADLEAVLEKQQMSHLVVSPDGKLLAGITGNSDDANIIIKVLQRP
ncbi:WD40 repeat domain-containing protein [Anabaena sp. WFMT]|uniref:WD40 repeat domain-containing protein n=1 Tax=Anabaena sp. WFMT TaxID=3449730 RepID=UPI003F24BB13